MERGKEGGSGKCEVRDKERGIKGGRDKGRQQERGRDRDKEVERER